jgi:protein phosphatase
LLRVAEQYATSDTGLQRRANEDSLLARSPLFVVADGMGGAQAGEVASRIAVESFQRGLDPASTPELALATLALDANARIHELSQANAEHAGMGTTLTAIYVGEEEVTIAHVGDSRAYCLRDGTLDRLTDDHSLVDELIRQGRLTPEEAVEHPQRSVITRALGPEGTVEVDTRSFRARAGDVYLLCSDGLTTMVPEDLLRAVLLGHDRLRDAGEALIAAANEAGGRDNITVVLVRLEEVRPGSPGVEQATLSDAYPEPAPTGGAARALEADELGVQAPAGSPPTAAERRPSTAERRPSTVEHGPGTAERRPSAVRASVQRRLPRRGPPSGDGSSSSRGRLRKRVRRATVLAVTLVTLALIGSAVYLALQSVYFIGTNGRGLVTLYNGLPFRLPGGIPLYTTTYVSGVSASTIAPGRRRSLLDHSLRSESDAASLIRSVELGQLE